MICGTFAAGFVCPHTLQVLIGRGAAGERVGKCSNVAEYSTLRRGLDPDSTAVRRVDTLLREAQPMSIVPEPGELLVKCECGFEARGKETELVSVVQKHGREVHNMDATPEQVLAMARPA